MLTAICISLILSIILPAIVMVAGMLFDWDINNVFRVIRYLRYRDPVSSGVYYGHNPSQRRDIRTI